MTAPPGVAAERTRLAWRRTSLASTAVLLLATTRAVTSGGRPAMVAAASIMALAWLGLLAVTHRRLAVLGDRLTGTPPATTAPAATALLVTVLAAGALVLIAG